MECCDDVVKRESLRQERSRWSCSFRGFGGVEVCVPDILEIWLLPLTYS